MQRYTYAFRFEEADGEIWLRIPKLPGLVSAMPVEAYRRMTRPEMQAYVTDAAITELQAIIATKAEVPSGDERLRPEDNGLIALSIQQSIKLELFKLYRTEFRSVAELARHLGKMETTMRRMLDLRYSSSVQEIEDTIEALGRRLVVTWETELIGPAKHTARAKRPERTLALASQH